MARVRFRVYLGDGHSVGPGKIQLLENVRDQGSISAAARAMGMAYRHAWELVDDMNQCFRTPVVETASGGRSGGGAQLTALGAALIERFHSMEVSVQGAIARDLEALEAEVAPGQRGSGVQTSRRRRVRTPR
ncbi:MAG: winged helix-turn-helix domain-containing protein [Myxococcota bacterium]